MTQVAWTIVLSTLAGLAIPTGALLATAERIHPMWMANEVRHAVIAFGGGVLLSAVALVLVPEGAAVLSTTWVVLLFAGGGILYLMFQDLAPQAKLRNRQAPAIGAVAGFLCGLVGHMLIAHPPQHAY